jgi:hypothetical protein
MFTILNIELDHTGKLTYASPVFRIGVHYIEHGRIVKLRGEPNVRQQSNEEFDAAIHSLPVNELRREDGAVCAGARLHELRVGEQPTMERS